MRATIPLFMLLVGCAPHAQECRRRHGQIALSDYLAERGLDTCPGVPDDACRGRLLSLEAASCVLEELNNDEWERWDEDSLLPVSFGTFEEATLNGLSYVPELGRGEFVWDLVAHYEPPGYSVFYELLLNAHSGRVLEYPETDLERTEPF